MIRISPAQRHHLFAGILIAVFLAQSSFASLQKSPVYDEPPHIAAGLPYLATGVFRANPQHPPLLKEMSAVFLEGVGIHWPQSDAARALIAVVPAAEGAEWPIGNAIIAGNGPDRVLFWARLPFILLAGLLGVVIYVWGRELVAAAGIYPDHLSYFNEAACLLEKPGLIGWDRSRCGPLWLEDSNVDWGQGLNQLRAWEQRRPDVPALRLVYAASFPPEGYPGLRFELFNALELLHDPDPGWYAVSASLVARLPAVGRNGQGSWLRRVAPADIAGHAFYIYQVR